MELMRKKVRPVHMLKFSFQLIVVLAFFILAVAYGRKDDVTCGISPAKGVLIRVTRTQEQCLKRKALIMEKGCKIREIEGKRHYYCR